MPKKEPTMEEKFEKAEAEINKLYEDFDPTLLTKRSKEVQVLFVEGMGKVKFGPLTFNDIIKIEKEGGNPNELGIKFIHAMLQKGYPDLKVEDVFSWESGKITALSLAFQRAGFFQPPPRSA